MQGNKRPIHGQNLVSFHWPRHGTGKSGPSGALDSDCTMLPTPGPSLSPSPGPAAPGESDLFFESSRPTVVLLTSHRA